MAAAYAIQSEPCEANMCEDKLVRIGLYTPAEAWRWLEAKWRSMSAWIMDTRFHQTSAFEQHFGSGMAG
jgi:hypothetical protein